VQLKIWEVEMRMGLVCAGLAVALLGGGGAAQSAMPKFAKPSVESPVQSVVCKGNRRNYRNFNHCWRVNSKRNPRWAANYCGRICSTSDGE
jgi:hypothetical protein